MGRLGTAGKLLSEDQYFRLAASDALGRRWVAEKIIPDTAHGTDGLISASGIIHSLTNVQEQPYSAYYQELHFFEDIDFPCNANTSIYTDRGEGARLSQSSNDLVKLRSADCDIAIHKGNGVVTVKLDSSSPFPAHIETRIVEALQFVLGRSLWWRALKSIIGNEETITLVSPRPASPRTRLRPPIALWTMTGHQYVWQLFDLYLRYILQRSEPGWHPCSVHLHAACEASANSIEAYALGLAVAVEGITSALFPKCARYGRDYKSLVNNLCTYVSQWGLNASDAVVARVRDRIQGFRGQLLQVRAVDKMYQLAREGVLDERHIAAWKTLRNTSAHAGVPGTPINQELIDNVSSATVLMYHLVFHAIGYNGRYIDYSTHGYPPRSYPSREIAPDHQ